MTARSMTVGTTRQLRRACGWFAIVIPCLLVWACGDSAIVTALPPTSPTPPTATLNARIDGFVMDGTGQGLNDALVEVVWGAPSVRSVRSAADGSFSLASAAFTSTISVRASKDGYVAATTVFSPNSSWRNIVLRLAAQPEIIAAGVHTLTFKGDCPDFPEDLRTRRFEAWVENSSLEGSMEAVYVLPRHPRGGSYGEGFYIGIAGDRVAFDLGAPFHESLLPSFTELRFTARARTTAGTSASGAVVIPFSGTFEYCTFGDERGGFCDAPGTVVRQCMSDRHQMIFERR